MLNTETATLKQFINSFDFENPNWIDLPEGFPFCETRLLNKEESGLYSGIAFAWLVYRTDVFKEEYIQQKIRQSALVNNLYLSGKILFFFSFLS